jgi:hypothetical protein
MTFCNKNETSIPCNIQTCPLSGFFPDKGHDRRPRMPRNRLPRVMKHYSPTGRRNYGRPLKRLLDTWDQNRSTNGPTPWQIHDDDDNHVLYQINVEKIFELLLQFVLATWKTLSMFHIATHNWIPHTDTHTQTLSVSESHCIAMVTTTGYT